MKTFSNRQNAIRAARAALGAEAQPGRDFTLTETDGRFAWAVIPEGFADAVKEAPAAPAVEIDDEAAAEAAVPSFLKAGRPGGDTGTGEALPTGDQTKPVDAEAALAELTNTIRGKILGWEKAAGALPSLTDGPLIPDALREAFNLGISTVLHAAVGNRRARRAPRQASRGLSKREIAAQLLQRPEGATARELMDATGWPSISVPATAKASGLTLRQAKDGKVTRYYGAPDAGAA